MSDAIMAATGESVAVDGWCILIGVTDYTLSDGQTGAGKRACTHTYSHTHTHTERERERERERPPSCITTHIH